MGQGTPFYPGQDGSPTKTYTEEWRERTKHWKGTPTDDDDDSPYDSGSSDDDED